ncbi:MAG: hypothetical protein SGBAC_009825 [Bacillariaceae sp.]
MQELHQYDDETRPTSMMAERNKNQEISPTRQKPRMFKMFKQGSSDKEVELALTWLYTRDKTLKDAKYFQKLNTMVPLNAHNNTTHKNTYEQRAQDLAETLTWMRNRRRERDAMEQSCSSTCCSTMTN